MAQRAGVPPSRILYVGDSEEHDVIGGRAAGMCTALIRRDDPWDQNNGAVARGKGSSADIILRSLEIEELEAKVEQWANSALRNVV